MLPPPIHPSIHLSSIHLSSSQWFNCAVFWLQECPRSGLQSPPVPARRNELRAAGNCDGKLRVATFPPNVTVVLFFRCSSCLVFSGQQPDVFSGLSALRHQLHSQQRRLEERMQQGDWEELDSPLSDGSDHQNPPPPREHCPICGPKCYHSNNNDNMKNCTNYASRSRDRPPLDVFDMARLRLPVPVRRPSSRKVEPRNLLRIHDSLQLHHSGKFLMKSVSSEHPDVLKLLCVLQVETPTNRRRWL